MRRLWRMGAVLGAWLWVLSLGAADAYHLADLTYGLETDRITAVAVHPRDGDLALAGVDGRVFKTDDGGETWRIVLSFRFGLPGDQLSGADRDRLEDQLQDLADDEASRTGDETVDREDLDSDEVAEEEEEEVELDDGLPAGELDLEEDDNLPDGSFSGEEKPVFARTLPGVRTLRFAPGDPDVVYAATPMGLFRSIDRGDHFDAVPLPHGRGALDVRDVAINPAIPTHLIVATRAGALESLDGGFSWTALPGHPGHEAALCVLMLPDATSTVLVGTEQGLYRSDDAGRTYLLQLLAGGDRDQPVSSVAYDPHHHDLYVGTGRDLLRAGMGESLFTPVDLGEHDQIERVVVSAQPSGPVAIAARRGLYLLHPKRGEVTNLLAEGDVHGAVDVSLDGRATQVLWAATDRGLFRRIKGSGQSGIKLIRRRYEDVVKREPTLDEVVQAAITYDRVEARRAQWELQRAQLAAALPRVDVVARHLRVRDDGIGWGLGGTQGLEVLDEFADFYGDIYDQEPMYQRSRVVTSAWATLSWDFDAILAPSQATAVSREEGRLASRRDKITSRVMRAYTARQRSLAQVVARRSRETAIEARRLLKLLEYTAQLDASTGGYFSREARARGAETVLGVSYDGTTRVDDAHDDDAHPARSRNIKVD
ncbi:MAG: hypothetical protein ABIJ09_26870 [Pseudomonadota bacterium]